MSLRCFRTGPLETVRPGAKITLERAEETHLFRILRAQPGETVGLLDGLGFLAEAEILPGRILQVSCVREIPVPQKRIHLYIAPPRRQKMDIVLRQCTELGVWRIVPVLCEFGISEPDSSSVAGRWTDALFEACKQSGNPFLPEAAAPLKFADSLADAAKHCKRLFYGSVDSGAEVHFDSGDAAWFVGPEGGFSPSELAALKTAAEPLRIGGWILRVETAAAAGTAVLSALR